MLKRRTAYPGAAAVLLGALALGGASAPSALQAPANGELGFIVTAFAPAVYQGKEDCPDGLSNTVQQTYLESLPAPERARLQLKANEPELAEKWKASGFGPNNTNLCANPELFDRPLQKINNGRIANGLNLDGDGSGAGHCAHADFTSPAGERGIDNQVYRALGCSRTYRGVDGSAGDIVKGNNAMLATGEHSMLLLLRGVDSLQNDDHVEIILANTDDRPVLDSKRNFITQASYSVTDNPHWRNVLSGRIVNGVLVTDPKDIRLTYRLGHGGVRGAQAEMDLRQGRFQLAFKPDGSVTGLFGAYQPPANVIQSTILGGFGAVVAAGMDCASQLKTLTALADGGRDPATGKCTTISMALDVEAVPAFVIDTPARKIASVEGKN